VKEMLYTVVVNDREVMSQVSLAQAERIVARYQDSGYDAFHYEDGEVERG
jgi:hypothetical protein